MEILGLIEELEEAIEDASAIPFSTKVVIDKEEISEIIRRINVAIPEEIRRAKWIKEEKDQILMEAKKEAEEMIRSAQGEQDRLINHSKFEENRVLEEARTLADKLVCENEITVLAENHCRNLVKEAEETSEEIKSGAYDYADSMLADLDKRLKSFSEIIHKNRSELTSYKNED